MRVKVIHRKRRVENVGNYNPIWSLPALYKQFTTILCGRLCPRFDQTQAEYQAGFRSSYQTTDHLSTYRMIEQECHEWGIKMWAATLDFTKTFNSITHKSIWDALKSCNIEHDYIRLLKKLYGDQEATVLTDEESDMFEIKKGSKQVYVIKLALQHSSAESIRKINPALAKKRNGNIPERQRSRLPHKHDIC